MSINSVYWFSLLLFILLNIKLLCITLYAPSVKKCLFSWPGSCTDLISLHHITELAHWPIFSHVDYCTSVATSLWGTKVHQRWVGINPPHYLGPFWNHTEAPKRPQSPSLRCVVKELSYSFVTFSVLLNFQRWFRVRSLALLLINLNAPFSLWSREHNAHFL